MDKIRILIVDDEAMVRRGLRMRLELEPDLEIVGEAENGAQAVQEVRRLAPTVVLMDVSMPGMDGCEAALEVSRESPGTAIVMLTMLDDAKTRARAMTAGASAFVPKRRMDRALLDAIRRAAKKEG